MVLVEVDCATVGAEAAILVNGATATATPTSPLSSFLSLYSLTSHQSRPPTPLEMLLVEAVCATVGLEVANLFNEATISSTSTSPFYSFISLSSSTSPVMKMALLDLEITLFMDLFVASEMVSALSVVSANDVVTCWLFQ